MVFMKMKFGYFLGLACLLAVVGPVAANAKCKCGKPNKVVFNTETTEADQPVATTETDAEETKEIVQN
jgi:hypothetical protein